MNKAGAVLVSLLVAFVSTAAAQRPQFVSVSVGDEHSCALTRAGEMYCWGKSSDGAVGAIVDAQCSTAVRCASEAVRVYVDVVGFSAGYQHSCMIVNRVLPFCSGDNFKGALGNGRRTRETSFGPVELRQPFRAIAAGREFSCGITLDSLTYCWGRGSEGQLGRAASGDTALPVQVETRQRFTALDAGSGFACALDAIGQAYCWGRGRDGQLGTDTTLDSSIPSPVVGDVHFVAITAGADHACGIGVDSLAYCWGRGREGALGTAERRDSRRPAPVAGGLRFQSLSAGQRFTCGVALDGKAYCWGYETRGQLGGSSAPQSGSRPVGGGNVRVAFRSVSAGSEHACAIAVDWTVWCWGEGDYGQLGSATTYTRTPVPIVLRR